MRCVRIWFEKKGDVRYISHLDLMRTMTRAIRRSKIPLWYTEGFNPHPYMTFVLPLSLGMESENDAMDIRVEGEITNREVMSALSEVMPDGILYSNLLLKMYLMSLKHNGILLLHENLPHTPQTIATFTRHQIGTVERALQIFLKLGFVELLTDGAYYMPDIQLLVGRSSTEAERKRRERLRLQAQKLLSNSKADICPPENRDKEIREQKCARTNIRTYEVTEEDVV